MCVDAGGEMQTDRRSALRNLVPHFTRGDAWLRSDLPIISHGDGCYVTDTDGIEYFDGLSGLFCTNLGHGRSDLAAAAASQLDRLAFYPNWSFAHPSAIEAAAMVASVAPGDLDRVFFVNSGSEAIESALKFARCYHLANGEDTRHKVIARRWAYHGTTTGALAVTGVDYLRDPYLPMLPTNVRHVQNTLGSEHLDDTLASELECVKAVEQAIVDEGPETVSVVIAEPVQNGRGALVPPEGYWQELRRICDTYGVLLCADEVINSFGRLGHWFGCQRFGAEPDLITFAKGITSAYVPLGGLIVRGPLVERVWDSPMAMFSHGSTFGGHPVATAVASVNMAAMHEEDIFGAVLHNETYFHSSLEFLKASHVCVKDIRGTGYFYYIELMRDRVSGVDLDARESAQLLAGGLLDTWVRQARVLIRPDSRGAVMLAIAPPLVADRQALSDLVGRIDEVLDRIGGWLRASKGEARNNP